MSESVEYMNEQFLAYMKQDTNVFMTRILECPLDELYLVTSQYLTPYLKYIKENKRLFLTAVKNTKALRLEKSYDKMFQFRKCLPVNSNEMFAEDKLRPYVDMPWMTKPYFYSSDIRGLHRAKLSPYQKRFYAKLYRLRIVE